MPSSIIEAFDNTSNATQNTTQNTTVNTIKTTLDTLKNNINNHALKDELTENAINTFIGGIPSNPGLVSDYINLKITQLNNSFTDFKNNMITPLQNLNTQVNSITNVNTATEQLNNKMDSLDELKGRLETLGTDLSTAYTREALVDTKNVAASYKQTWGMIERPIRRQSIPVLIVFSLLFLTAAGVGIWYLSPFATAVASDMAPSLFQRPIIWFSAVGLIVCAVIWGILAFLRLI